MWSIPIVPPVLTPVFKTAVVGPVGVAGWHLVLVLACAVLFGAAVVGIAWVVWSKRQVSRMLGAWNESVGAALGGLGLPGVAGGSGSRVGGLGL